MNGVLNALENLFSTAPYCNGGGHGGCGCNNGNRNFANGFITGVNAANAANNINGGCGCNGNGNWNGNGGCGCGCNGNGNNAVPFANGFGGDLSGYTGCGCPTNDCYYARQYALYPFNNGGNNGCNCF